MEKVKWEVEGMSCTNCALTIHKYLEAEGVENVKVNFMGGEVSFDINGNVTKEQLKKGIRSLGYKVHSSEAGAHGHDHEHDEKTFWFKTHLQRFIFCLIFTVPLLITHTIPFIHIHALMNP